MRYATLYEKCNLLFVFALNAACADEYPHDRNLLSRLVRVIDIRQGALEQAAIRDISLYNEVIKGKEGKPLGDQCHRQKVTTFCICPRGRLDVDTFNFLELRAKAAKAYNLMYQATKSELKLFDISSENTEVWMSKVNDKGEIKYKDYTLRA